MGDPHFIATANNPLNYSSSGPNLVEGRELNSPEGIAIDNNGGNPLIYIADTANNRVLGFKFATQMTPGAKADVVLGQQDFFTTTPGGPGTGFSTGLSFPTGLVVDAGGNLYVADTGNNRVLRYPRPFGQPAGYQYPDLVIGQSSFVGQNASPFVVKQSTLQLNNGSYIGRNGLAMDSGGNLWVADTGDNRVLRFPSFALKNASNNPNADIAVGQQDLLSSSLPASRIDKTTLGRPSGIGFDGQGHLYVGDGFNRVLVYPIGVGPNTSASRILGIPQTSTSPVSEISFGASTGNQFGIAGNSGATVVSDLANNRVLIYDTFGNWTAEGTQFSPSAKGVIGQASFGDSKANLGNPEAANNSLSSPVDVAISGSEVFVVDSGNNRVLVFPSSAGTLISGTASRVIGQLDFPFSAPNLIEGHEFNFAPNSGFYGAAVLDNSVVPARLYVSDTFNNRILGFSNFAALKNGDFPDLVLGQPDFHRNLINYPNNDQNKPNSIGLYLPSGLAVDSAGNLYVADTGNSRVVRFPTPYAGAKAGASADLVIGQANFTTTVTDASQRTMRKPISIALTADAANSTIPNSGFLIVSDSALNRVTFYPKPFSSGMNASKVLGQLGFTDTIAAKDLSRFNTPKGVAVDQFDRVIVVDSGNSRISCFDRASSLSNLQAPFFAVSSPGNSVSTGSNNDFWVSDAGTNSIYHFPSIDNLPVKNYASDGSLPAVGPISVFVDSFQNVVVGDSANRVVYFVPQVTVESSANYSTRPLSPGTIASLFPTVTKNTLAAATQTFDSLPNPIPVATTLADTQVLVNGVSSPLFYVSPSQINLPLSYSLPSGGSVDLQVIRKSTGQITGAAEIQLSSASPGLYTVNSAGYGQTIAVHPDQSLNSPTNPITRGQYVTLYGTGEGVVPNAPGDGQVSTGPIANPNFPVITLNNGSSQYTIPSSAISYSGIAPGLVGVWQINVTIPSDAPSGNYVKINVQEYGYPSTDPANTALTTTTIAIK